MDEEGIAELFMDDNVLADIASMDFTTVQFIVVNTLYHIHQDLVLHCVIPLVSLFLAQVRGSGLSHSRDVLCRDSYVLVLLEVVLRLWSRLSGHPDHYKLQGSECCMVVCNIRSPLMSITDVFYAKCNLNGRTDRLSPAAYCALLLCHGLIVLVLSFFLQACYHGIRAACEVRHSLHAHRTRRTIHRHLQVEHSKVRQQA